MVCNADECKYKFLSLDVSKAGEPVVRSRTEAYFPRTFQQPVFNANQQLEMICVPNDQTGDWVIKASK